MPYYASRWLVGGFAVGAAFFSTASAAQAWAFGAVADQTPGLSLKMSHSDDRAVHFLGHFRPGAAVRAEVDLTRFYRPFPTFYRDLALYSGLGLSGRAQREDEGRESYHVVLPVGLQWDPKELPLEVFWEAAIMVGELPSTMLTGRSRGGIRAVF